MAFPVPGIWHLLRMAVSPGALLLPSGATPTLPPSAPLACGHWPLRAGAVPMQMGSGLAASTSMTRRDPGGKEVQFSLASPAHGAPRLPATLPSLRAVPAPGKLTGTECQHSGAVLGMWPLGQPGEAPNSPGKKRMTPAQMRLLVAERKETGQPAGRRGAGRQAGRAA